MTPAVVFTTMTRMITVASVQSPVAVINTVTACRVP
jgi:hypothetical protein